MLYPTGGGGVRIQIYIYPSIHLIRVYLSLPNEDYFFCQLHYIHMCIICWAQNDDNRWIGSADQQQSLFHWRLIHLLVVRRGLGQIIRTNLLLLSLFFFFLCHVSICDNYHHQHLLGSSYQSVHSFPFNWDG